MCRVRIIVTGMSMILITGGTGFVGQAVARRLTKRGYQCRLLSRRGPRMTSITGPGYEYVSGSVTHAAVLGEAAAGCTRLLHLAGHDDVPLLPAGDPYGNRMFDINVRGTRVVLDAARHAGIERSVVVTSCTTFGHAGDGVPNDGSVPHNVNRLDSSYVWSRVQQELVALEAAASGHHVAIVAPTVIVGPGDQKGSSQAIDAFRRGRIPVVPPGGYSFIGIDDIVSGLVAALERAKSGRRYIFSAENMTFRDFFARVGILVDRPPPRVLPAWTVRSSQRVLHTIGPLLRRATFRNPDALLAERYYFDAKLAVAELGLPQTPIDSAIEQTLNQHALATSSAASVRAWQTSTSETRT